MRLISDLLRKVITSLRNRLGLFLQYANAGIRNISAWTHRWQKSVQWGHRYPPEHFDHYIDLHYQLPKLRSSFPFERGVWASFAIGPHTKRVLDLGCGDGFFPRHFLSLRVDEIVAVDFDATAISHARRFNSAPNIKYLLSDIRHSFPVGEFDLVTWDAAIEHFTEQEIGDIMTNIKAVLIHEGVMAGYTIKKDDHARGPLHHLHEYEFESKEDLARFFTPWFQNVQVFETNFPARTNYYFFASDGKLPFDSGQSLTIRQQPSG